MAGPFQSESTRQRKASYSDPSDFRRLKLHEATFKGFDGKRATGPGLSEALLEGEGRFVFRGGGRVIFLRETI